MKNNKNNFQTCKMNKIKNKYKTYLKLYFLFIKKIP